MVASVTLYYETGLSPGNCLDSISKLSSLAFTAKTFPNVAIKQDRGRVDIRINATYADVKNADYCKINSSGYWVTGINMLNDHCAMVLLQQDYLTTIGVSNLSIVSGWCTRRSVSDDTLFKNTLPENFTPSQELVVDGCTEISNGSSETGHINVLLCNLDILNLTDLAKAYTATLAGKDVNVVVPKLPSITDGGTKYYFHPQGASNTYSTNIAMTKAFNPNNTKVKEGVSEVRALGIESCIGASYNLPLQWVDATEDGNGVYTMFVDKWKNTKSALKTHWGSYKNNKVYSGQFQSIVCYSICSGEQSTFKVEDVINSDGDILWTLFADLRYNGYPACKPSTYRSKHNSSMFGVVKGANWQQTPFMYTYGSSGYAVGLQSAAQNYASGKLGAIGGLANNLVNFGSMMNSAAMSNASAQYAVSQAMYNAASPNGASAAAYALAANDMTYKSNNWALGTNLVGNSISAGAQLAMNRVNFNDNVRSLLKATPEIQFPVVPQLQDFIGNKFYEMHYRLSNTDMTRFDNYLTQFGYAVSEKLTTACFTGRTHFNYVQGEDVTLNATAPLYLRNGAAEQIMNGVRIWHTKPSSSALVDNPIA